MVGLWCEGVGVGNGTGDSASGLKPGADREKVAHVSRSHLNPTFVFATRLSGFGAPDREIVSLSQSRGVLY